MRVNPAGSTQHTKNWSNAAAHFREEIYFKILINISWAFSRQMYIFIFKNGSGFLVQSNLSQLRFSLGSWHFHPILAMITWSCFCKKKNRICFNFHPTKYELSTVNGFLSKNLNPWKTCLLRVFGFVGPKISYITLQSKLQSLVHVPARERNACAPDATALDLRTRVLCGHFSPPLSIPFEAQIILSWHSFYHQIDFCRQSWCHFTFIISKNKKNNIGLIITCQTVKHKSASERQILSRLKRSVLQKKGRFLWIIIDLSLLWRRSILLYFSNLWKQLNPA